jgi:hypothetical protein
MSNTTGPYSDLEFHLTIDLPTSGPFTYPQAFDDVSVSYYDIDLTGAPVGDPTLPVIQQQDIARAVGNIWWNRWQSVNGVNWGNFAMAELATATPTPQTQNPWPANAVFSTVQSGVVTASASSFTAFITFPFNAILKETNSTATQDANLSKNTFDALKLGSPSTAAQPFGGLVDVDTEITTQQITLGWAAVFGGSASSGSISIGAFNSSSFACFIHGTIFHTLKDNTEVPIEIQNLKVGDLVKTEVYVNQKECQFSLEAWQIIKRIIRRPLTADEYANKTRILPKDALGPGKPDKDLHVTWGHGLLLKEMKEEWKNDEYDSNHVTYSKEHALVKGDFIKLLAGHCALCRKPNEEENKKAADEREKRAYYHLMLEDTSKGSQHALVTHGVTSESLVRL